MLYAGSREGSKADGADQICRVRDKGSGLTFVIRHWPQSTNLKERSD
jgi:hypothetical protein